MITSAVIRVYFGGFIFLLEAIYIFYTELNCTKNILSTVELPIREDLIVFNFVSSI